MQPVAVSFPDAAALVLDELRAALPAIVGRPVPVGNRVPSPRPERFVVARRMGGTRETLITEVAHLAVECWATSAQDADDLAQAARTVIFAMAHRVIAGVRVYRVEDIGGPADVPDPLSDQPRYSFAVAVTVRGT